MSLFINKTIFGMKNLVILGYHKNLLANDFLFQNILHNIYVIKNISCHGNTDFPLSVGFSYRIYCWMERWIVFFLGFSYIIYCLGGEMDCLFFLGFSYRIYCWMERWIVFFWGFSYRIYCLGGEMDCLFFGGFFFGGFFFGRFLFLGYFFCRGHSASIVPYSLRFLYIPK